MFKSARIKLTFWYLLIIMLISLFFSIAIYHVLTVEFERGLRIQRFRIENPQRLFDYPDPSSIFRRTAEPEIIKEIKERIILNLFEINLGLLILSGITGYFLAGRTLKPIEEMVEVQDRFIADASHELRTPLTAMKTETEVALRDKKLDLKQAKNYLQNNLEEIEKIQTLSNYLLNLNRYRNPRSKLRVEKINLSEVIKRAWQKVETASKLKKIKLEKENVEIEFQANFAVISELLAIFFDNAIKFSQKNGKIIVIAKKEADKVIISIKDFGIGIKTEDLPHIFDRFYRANTSRCKTKVDGYGLGLSIAKDIVDQYQGSIDVQSTPDKGSTFTIVLPLIR